MGFFSSLKHARNIAAYSKAVLTTIKYRQDWRGLFGDDTPEFILIRLNLWNAYTATAEIACNKGLAVEAVAEGFMKIICEHAADAGLIERL